MIIFKVKNKIAFSRGNSWLQEFKSHEWKSNINQVFEFLEESRIKVFMKYRMTSGNNRIYIGVFPFPIKLKIPY
jgi:hypothetical protein